LFDCYRTSVCINNQCFGTHQPSGRTKARTSSSPSVRTAYDLEASQSSVLKFQEDRHQVRCVETDVFSGRSVQSCEEALQQRQRSNRCFRAIGPSISCAYFCLQEFHMCCQGALTHLEKHQLLRSGVNPLCVQAVTRLTCKSSLQEGVETAESTDKGMSTLDTEHEKYSKWSRSIARCLSLEPTVCCSHCSDVTDLPKIAHPSGYRLIGNIDRRRSPDQHLAGLFFPPCAACRH